MKQLKKNNIPVEPCDSLSAPSPFRVRNDISFHKMTPLTIVMGSQDQFLQTNRKAQFLKLKQKADIQQSASSQTKTQYSAIDFEILSQSQIVKNMIDLKHFLNFGNNSIEFGLKLIFRASQHNFDVKKFHQICDNVQNSLVLAQISNGSIFGGFTPLSFNDNYSKAGTYFKSDKSQQSFLFNFTTRQKYKLIKQANNKAVIGCNYLGPTYGGYDLCIGNFAHRKYSSSCDFPISYSIQNKQKNVKLNRKSLIGTNQELFLLRQWEVFEVVLKKGCVLQEELKNIIQINLKKSKQNIQSKQNKIFKGFFNFFRK